MGITCGNPFIPRKRRSIKTAHEFGAKELILPHHAGSKRFVRNLVTKPQNELTDAKRVNNRLLVEIGVVGDSKRFLVRFRHVMQDLVVELVVNVNRYVTHHRHPQELRILC